MKKLLLSTQVILFGLFNITLFIGILQVSGDLNPLARFDRSAPGINRKEDFDPELVRLNSMNKLAAYCDSLFDATCCPANQEDFEESYTNLVSAIIRKRFYHGYSHYGFTNNYLALRFAKSTREGYSAVVIPNDILKYPYAACSQQSIVMMELLNRKGLNTRKISFPETKDGGHFCFEVFYKGSWHFYDPNMEPDAELLNSYGRPGIAYLATHTDLLLKAYRSYPKSKVLNVFSHYAHGPVNQFPAPRAIVFHKTTKILSYSIWLFFLAAFLLVRRSYRRLISKQHVWNRGVYFPQSERGTSSSYYPGLTAPGA